MKKICSIVLTLMLALIISPNYVEATDTKTIETSCITKCEQDNYEKCDEICDQISFCYDACNEYETDEYCEKQCYIIHYHEPYETQDKQTCFNNCRSVCEKQGGNTMPECIEDCSIDCGLYTTPDNSDKTNNNTYPKINCGGITLPKQIAKLVSTVINLIKIAVPILLVIVGSLDFMKAVMAQKEDEINKAKNMFVKRLISAIMVFLVFFIVQLVIGLVAPHDEESSMWDCVDCFINGDC